MSPNVLFDQAQLLEAFSHFPSGVAAIAAQHHDEAHVIVASSFSVGVSLEPPLAAFYVQRSSSTWPLLKQAQRLGVSILSAEQAAICYQLAGRNKKNRFKDVDLKTTDSGAIRLNNAAIWFECSIHAVHEAGDHLAIQLRIHDLHTKTEQTPLVFHRSTFAHLQHSPTLASQAAC